MTPTQLLLLDDRDPIGCPAQLLLVISSMQPQRHRDTEPQRIHNNFFPKIHARLLSQLPGPSGWDATGHRRASEPRLAPALSPPSLPLLPPPPQFAFKIFPPASRRRRRHLTGFLGGLQGGRTRPPCIRAFAVAGSFPMHLRIKNEKPTRLPTNPIHTSPPINAANNRWSTSA
jgi:hypothetical protein